MKKNKFLDLNNASREELRVEMCRLQDEAFKYRQAIERIDKKDNEEKFNNLLNRCFVKDDYFYINIERYDENYQLYGTTTYSYNEHFSGGSINVDAHIWEDDIENSKEITKEEFNKKLKEILDHIKFIE